MYFYLVGMETLCSDNNVIMVTITGKTLMYIKSSFSNVANVLLDWDEVHNDDFCSWRGVSCGNISTSIVALYVRFAFCYCSV